MTDYAIYLDTSKCTGCKGCQVACKCWNLLPSPTGLNANPPTGSYQSPADLNGDTRLIVTFNETDTNQKWGVDWSIGRRSCNHCINPACVAVCSTGCLKVDEATGFVTVDEKKCIGCEYCASACPFDVPRYHAGKTSKSEGEGKDNANSKSKKSNAKVKINKCTACIDRISNGKAASINDGKSETEMQFNKPACVHTCTAGALLFGPRDEMIEIANKRVEALKSLEINPAKDASVYGVDQLDGLHVITVLKYPAETYGLPANPSVNPITGLLGYMRPLTGLAAAATVLGLGIAYLRGVGYQRDTLHYDSEKHETVDMDTGEVVWRQGDVNGTSASETDAMVSSKAIKKPEQTKSSDKSKNGKGGK